MPLDQLYQAAVLEHNRNPCGRGELAHATHSARGQDALCGDDIEIRLRLENGQVVEAGFTGEACAVTMASASMLMAWLPGRSPDEINARYESFRKILDEPDRDPPPELGDFAQLQSVGHFKSRVRNALLPWKTLLAALDRPPTIDHQPPL